jgi:hypothetical protein
MRLCTAAGLLSALFCVIRLPAQTNLIPNPGFDAITNCPHHGEIEFAPPWSWVAGQHFASSQQKPRLFNACVAPSSFPDNQFTYSVPDYGYGESTPSLSGGGYALVQVHSGNGYLRTSLQVPLPEPLQRGRQYWCEFYVWPFKSDVRFSNYFTNSIALGFVPDAIDTLQPESTVLGLSPVTEIPPEVIRDTLHWTRLSGCYAATGDERHAVIGNFFSDAQTKLDWDPGATAPQYCHFLVENVGVYEFNPLPDTVLLCAGQPVPLDALFLDAAYRWNTGATTNSIAVAQPGRYSVEATIRGCSLTDTVEVIDPQAFFEALPVDTVICRGEAFRVDFSGLGAVQWSDGSAVPRRDLRHEGTYQVEVQTGCGAFAHTFQLETEVCDCPIYVANVFSPNGDGRNDELDVQVACDFPFRPRRFQVFDRWGELIYDDPEPVEGSIRWDGRGRHGETAVGQVYVWVLDYEYTRHGETRQGRKSGDVLVLN